MKVVASDRLKRKCLAELKGLAHLQKFSIDQGNQIKRIVFHLNEYDFAYGLNDKEIVSRLIQKLANDIGGK